MSSSTLAIPPVRRRAGMGSHQSASAQKTEWLTPPEILAALGDFDLDPCAPIHRPWEMAARHYTIADNGLHLPWQGRIWLNPPYGQETSQWLEALAHHADGIALVFARTETDAWFKSVWNKADSVFFLKGRIRFHHVDGTKAKENGGAPSALIAYNPANTRVLARCGLAGKLITL